MFEIDELQELLDGTIEQSKDLEIREKAKVLHVLIDSAAKKKNYLSKKIKFLKRLG